LPKELPKKKISKKQINNSLTDYDLIPVSIDKLFITMNDEPYILLVTEEKSILFELNNIESSMLTFIASGCELYTHVSTIYHLYISTLEYLGTKIVSSVIEAKDGDVYYGRICLEDKNQKKIYCQCAAGDAIVLSSFCKCDLFIIRKVLNDSDAFDEKENEENIFYDE
jgi:bifunctional DNase/RNase